MAGTIRMGTPIDLEPIKALKKFSFGNAMVLGLTMQHNTLLDTTWAGLNSTYVKFFAVKTYVWFLFVELTASIATNLFWMSCVRPIFLIVSIQIL